MYLTQNEFKQIRNEITKATIYLSDSNLELKFDNIKIDGIQNSDRGFDTSTYIDPVNDQYDFKVEININNTSYETVEDAIAKVGSIGNLNLRCVLETSTKGNFMRLEEIYILGCSNNSLVLISKINKINKKYLLLTLESISKARFGDMSMELLNG